MTWCMKNLEKYQAILFDFDGVLCKDHFYTNLISQYPEVYDYIQDTIFWGSNDLCHRWMKNELTMQDINKYISENTDINYEILVDYFEQSIKEMKIDLRLINLAKIFKKQGKKIAIVTNNMDVFSQITVPHNGFDILFDVVINSADYALLKQEQDGKLFDIALKQIWIPDFGSCLLIDDSAKVRTVFESRGGDTFAYSNFEDFEKWVSG